MENTQNFSNNVLPVFETEEEKQALDQFRLENPELFQKSDADLFKHLGIVLSLLILSTTTIILTSYIAVKIFLGCVNALFYFSLINLTIHHHHTHHNAAKSPFAKKTLNLLYLAVLPKATDRLKRYTRAHLNHHFRPFHESDLCHHTGTQRYLDMSGSFWNRLIYFLELTFVGAYMPGPLDDQYMCSVPLQNWSLKDYQQIKILEKKIALQKAFLFWALFIAGVYFLPAVAWGWVFPMLLVRNWAHYLGQFQHYDERLLDEKRSSWNKTKTFRFPDWVDYLLAGEINGHYLHHLFPEIPYYNVTEASKKLRSDSHLKNLFVTY